MARDDYRQFDTKMLSPSPTTKIKSLLRSSHRHPLILVLIIFPLLLLTTLFWPRGANGPSSLTPSSVLISTANKSRFPPGTPKPHGERYSQTLVAASTRFDNTTWMSLELPNYDIVRYMADDLHAPFHPPTNKGRESMIYLTYIIDHYDNLSDTTVFIHAHRTAWHNNYIFELDMAPMLQHLSNEHVARVGFFNLRCHPESGCPAQIHTDAQHFDKTKLEEMHFREVWQDLHGPDLPLPSTIGAACCAQFAVSRARLHSISLDRWRQYRQWLLVVHLPDHISGRLFEYTWHIILTGETTLCPKMDVCYCDGYGLCLGSMADFDAWLAMKEVQFLALEMLQDYAVTGRDSHDLQERLDQRIGRPLQQRLEEAFRQGSDPQTRARLVGRPWRHGDGF